MTIDVLANDSDPEGGALTLVSVENPANGSTVIENGKIVYNPDLDLSGTDSFDYTVSDGAGRSATATVFLNFVDIPDQDTPANAAAAFGSTAFDKPDVFDASQNGAALVKILPGSNNVKLSNYGANSFTIENTGDVRIVGVYFDVSTALYGDMVFDPDGTGGDSVAKGLTINTPGGTSVVSPAEYDEFFQPTQNDADPLFADGVAQNNAQGGYRGLLLKFDANGAGSEGFVAGEQIGLSIDMDPNSLAGFKKGAVTNGSVPQWDVGGVSGAELIGSTISVLFADGTTATGQLMSDGSQAGAQALVTQTSPELSASVTVNGVPPGGTGEYSDAPIVVVSGPAGATIRVVLTKGFQPTKNDAFNARSIIEQRLADEDFAVNNAAEFQVVDITLGAGETSRDISSLFTYENDPNGFVFDGNTELPLGFVASVVDPSNDNLPLGPVSAPVYLSFDGEDVVPPPPPPPPPADEIELYLINADTDENLGQIVNGEIDSSRLNGAQYSLEARLPNGETAGSVTFALSTGQSRTENAAPYALFGDSNGGTNFRGGALPQDSFSATVTAYEQTGAGGAVIAQRTFDLALVDGGNPPPANTAPVAANDTAATEFETAVSIDVLANDSDQDGDDLFVTAVGDAQNGQTSLVGNEVVYVPDVDFSGTDSFTYSTSDPTGATDTATVTVTVAQGPTVPLPSGMFSAEFYDIEQVSQLSEIDFGGPKAAVDLVEEIQFTRSGGSFWEGGPINTFAARITGKVDVAQAGNYTFYLNSDDGSVLFINGQEVITNDGLHGMVTKTASVNLAAGQADIEVRYFENLGGAGLILDWEGPGTGDRTAVKAASADDATQPDLIVNGSFEDISAGTGPGSTPAGWTTTGTASGVFEATEARGDGYAYALGGWTSVGGQTLEQSVTTIQGTQYALSFDAGGAYSDFTGSLKVIAESTTGDQVLATYTSAQLGNSSPYSLPFTANDSQTNVKFLFDGSGSGDIDIDNVSLAAAPAPKRIEFGSVTTTQDNRSEWHSVEFDGPIANAIVVMGPPSTEDAEPLAVRIRNVTETGFEFQMTEWGNLDGAHATETIAWLAATEGEHQLSDGRTIVAGQTTAQNTSSVSEALTGFDATPVVLAQVSSDNDVQPVTERVDDVTTSGFSVRLQEEEAADQVHASETIDFIALETGTGATLSVGATANAVKNLPFEITSDGIDDFIFLADMQTADGLDTAALRQTSSESGVSVFVEEETSLNAETNHTTEVVGFVFAQEGTQDLI